MKRPAETALDASDNQRSPDTSNPFAGVSLFSSASSSFLTASTSGFSAGASPGRSEAANQANPFMGLSLFSAPTTSGSLFTAAVTTLHDKSSEGAPVPPGPPQPAEAPAPDQDEEAEGVDTAEDKDGEEKEDEKEEREGEGGDEPTGEEDEEVIFRADCKLWKLVKLMPDTKERSEGWRWQERGCGIVHINRHKKTRAGRLVMRMRGVLKLLLNTPIFPTTRYEMVGQKSVRFVGVDADKENSEKEVPLCAFRLNLHSSDQQGKFMSVVRDLTDVAKD
mmetsp:Transcript_29604/g.55410  ORF Transcript_29604/g.55410 Transcript_29604/m.55410 type:complete len:278 (+) Transcript_29604:68-901(+)